MSRREEFGFEFNKEDAVSTAVPKKNIVDDSISQIEALKAMADSKTAEAPPAGSVYGVEKAKGVLSFDNGVKINIPEKNNKTVRKSFIFSEKLNKRFSAIARNSGISENELINKILEQLFGL